MKFTTIFLSSIFITVGLICYILAIADRDTNKTLNQTTELSKVNPQT